MARMRVPKMVKNGFYSYFGVWGEFWAANLILLQYSPFLNLHGCSNFWKAVWLVFKSRRKSIRSPCLNRKRPVIKEAHIKDE